MAKSRTHHKDNLIVGALILVSGLIFYPTTCCMEQPHHPVSSLGQLMFVSYVWIGFGMICFHGYRLWRSHT